MARSKTGEAISPERRTPTARRMLCKFIDAANQRSDLAAWKRGRAVLGYITGTSVIALAAHLEVTRGAVNQWLQWYEVGGVEELVTRKPPGAPSRLSEAQRVELAALIEAGPRRPATSPGSGPAHDRRPDRAAVRRALPQPSLASAAERARLFHAAPAQAARACRRRGSGRVAARPPACDQKKAAACRGVVMFGDEASFWLDGTLHRTWARIGVQPRVDTFGARKTAHVSGVISLEKRPMFFYQFASVFNGQTFLDFLKELVRPARASSSSSSETGRATTSTRAARRGSPTTPTGSSSSGSRPTRPSSTRSRASGRRPRSRRPTTASSTRPTNATPRSAIPSAVSGQPWDDRRSRRAAPFL